VRVGDVSLGASSAAGRTVSLSSTPALSLLASGFAKDTCLKDKTEHSTVQAFTRTQLLAG